METLYVLCFSEDGPRYWPAPHQSGRAERAAFISSNGWNVAAHQTGTGFRRGYHDDGAPTRFATIQKRNLDCGTGRPGERSRAVTHDAIGISPA